jgi:hypothetical protein
MSARDRNIERQRADRARRVAAKERVDRARKFHSDLLADETLDDLTKEEILRSMRGNRGGDITWSEDEFKDTLFNPGWNTDAYNTVMNRVEDLLNSAKTGEGEKFASRKATHELMQARRKAPGLMQVRGQRGGSGGIL